ncbi:uncharacterized protein LOC142576119 [Dermacentor variabilis]|uniref:uncharacterized protein LOC142576119 n=1 Tax=Dermacentor variabilis TaxID=34621 RepID=UPI003F5B6312
MVRTSLFMLLALVTVSQAFPPVRFRYLKTKGVPPRGDRRPPKPAPKSYSEPETSFLMPVISVGPVAPAFPPVVTGPLPLPLIPPTTPFIAADPPATSFLAANTPAVIPATHVVAAPTPFLSTVTRPENLTLTSRLSSGPSVTTTVFRAPGGVSATSVQRVEGSSTAFFREADTLTKVKPKPVSILVPAVGTVPQVVQAIRAPTTVVAPRRPPLSGYLFYGK